MTTLATFIVEGGVIINNYGSSVRIDNVQIKELIESLRLVEMPVAKDRREHRR